MTSVFQEQVFALHRRGFALIPVPHGQKRPVLRKWQHLRLTADDLRNTFGGQSNVGVLLGDPSGGLTDIDLDCRESVRLASRFLPPTELRSGRSSSPCSHWFFRTSEPVKTTQFRDPLHDTRDERSMLVELRSTGAQTLVPPSVHPSGEAIVWEREGEPAEIVGEVLVRAVSQVAATALLARYWPDEGSRHEAAMALAGGLLRSGWPEHDVEMLLHGVVETAGDPEIEDRLAAVRSTRAALDARRQVTGWNRLGKLVDAKIVMHVRDWLGAGDDPETPSSSMTRRRPSAPRNQGPSQATKIVELALEAGFVPFRDLAEDPFCTVPFDGHVETWEISAKRFRTHLSRVYYSGQDKAAGGEMLKDALNVLEGDARFSGPVIPVAVRIALHEDAVYLDLGNDAWQVVRITADGWSIQEANDCPVRFRRPKGLEALPTPRPPGDIRLLRPLLNLGDESDFLLIVAWMLSALYPEGPRPVLQLLGEQGSAKSSLARLVRSLVDPNLLPLRAAPRDEGDLLIAARNSSVIAYDNLSSMPRWLSDALCRLATGGGLSKRELYTDVDEVLLEARRPVILTGISDVATASDLLDRCLTVTLPPIPSDQRRTEREVHRIVVEVRPRILAALLDAVVVGLRRIKTIQLDHPPRLADFAAWVEACAPAFGWDEGKFLDVFRLNRKAADSLAVEAVSIGPAILALMTQEARWEGTASDLLTRLGELVAEPVRKEPDWPKRANRLSAMLQRLAPNLRQLGIDARAYRSSNGRRVTVLRRLASADAHSYQNDNLHMRRAATSQTTLTTSIVQPDTEADVCCVCGGSLNGNRYQCPSCSGEGSRLNGKRFSDAVGS